MSKAKKETPRLLTQYQKEIVPKLKERFGISPGHVEGFENARWVLLDYIDFVVHVFRPETRNFYQLERLWADAGRVEIEDRENGSG